MAPNSPGAAREAQLELHPDDAQLAIEHGAAGIIISNHGARNLDTVPATIDALPANARAYLARIETLTGVPIAMVSTGPDRDETILLHHPFH